ncbi:muscarinic acetylcholine receptor M1-like [Strongylocentrotus purpuratus]|uniref:G-protein coupled receptors family 1 profile domain-containing protein n=1 Tax=Strongylocentrotus purpuratus TaxID=7668 RepID=A0A7M7LKY1_STRPU|nr:muscarinic acetylcholine receptor M1-like [Strongylocentrotus purpuratus]|eukprot:XP_001188703.1 PREDICTED: muscarinic acetylcholine receptor M1-like [Strongylocentrotus purpuratus]
MFLSVTTAVLNVLILIAFHIEKKLRTYSNQYILNITISDLLVGFIMTINSVTYLYDEWIFGQTILKVFVGIQNTVITVSVLGIIAISLDRYVATHYPLQHFKRKKKNIAHIVNVMTWIVAACFWFPIATIWDFMQPLDVNPDEYVYTSNYSRNINARTVVTICRFVIPFSIIVLICVKIYHRVKTSGSESLSKRYTSEEKTGGKINATSIEQHGRTNDTFVETQTNVDSGVVKVLQENATKPSTSIQSDHIAVDIVEDVGQLGRIFSSSERSMQPIRHQFTPMPNTTQSTKPDGFQRNPRHLSSADNHKAFRTLTFIIVAFFITSLPGCISIITSNKTLAVVGRWMININSLLNPVTYAMAQPVFRKTLLRIVRCRR